MPQYLCAKPVTKASPGQVGAAVSSFTKPALPALGLVPFLLPPPLVLPQPQRGLHCPSRSASPAPGRGAPDGGAEEGCDGLHPQVWPPLLGSAPLAVAGTHDSRSVKHSLVASSRAAEQVWLPEAHPIWLGGPPWGKGRPGPQILLSIFFRFYTLVTN